MNYSVTVDKSNGKFCDGILFKTGLTIPYEYLNFNGVVKRLNLDYGNSAVRFKVRGLLDFLKHIPVNTKNINIEITPAEDTNVGNVIIINKFHEDEWTPSYRERELSFSEPITVKRKEYDVIVKRTENNEQKRVVDKLKIRGIKCIPEVTIGSIRIDLIINDDIIGEMKSNSDKDDYYKAIGQLEYYGNITNKRDYRFLLVTDPENIEDYISFIPTLTKLGISSFSIINGIVRSDNTITGHDRIREIMSLLND